MADVVTEVEESRPAKPKRAAKANGQAPVKAAGKGAAKTVKAKAGAENAPKATASPAKGMSKAKGTKAKPKMVEKDQFGLRKGSTKSRAAMLYARKSGATLAEVKNVLGTVQLNVLVGLEADGYRVTRESEKRDGKRPVTRYRLFPKT